LEATQTTSCAESIVLSHWISETGRVLGYGMFHATESALCKTVHELLSHVIIIHLFRQCGGPSPNAVSPLTTFIQITAKFAAFWSAASCLSEMPEHEEEETQLSQPTTIDESLDPADNSSQIDVCSLLIGLKINIPANAF
jgi:hypothetical protein